MLDANEAGKTILIVEDDESLLHFMGTALKKAGYEVIETDDGAEGDRLAREKRPDLVVQDIMLPGKSGLDVLDDIQSDPEFSHIPFILITSMTEESHKLDEHWRDRTGAADFISKPFPIGELVWRVAKILAAKDE